MIVKEMIEILKTLPQDMPVVMADLSEVIVVKKINYGNGVVVVSDEDEIVEND